MLSAKQLANLKPFSQRSKEEVRELNRKGGIKSGKTRGAMKTFREILIKQSLEKGAKGTTLKESICKSIYKEALKGNIRAAEFIRDIMGEKPTDKIELDNKMNFASDISFKKLVEVNDKLDGLRKKQKD